MAKTSIDVDLEIADRVAAILGTPTLQETINASLLEIVNIRRRLELVALFGEEGRFDFGEADQAWGGEA